MPGCAERTIRRIATGLESLDASPPPRDSVDARSAARSTLGTMERRYRSLAADRRDAIQERAFAGGHHADADHLQEYRYAALAVTRPALAAVAETLPRLSDVAGATSAHRNLLIHVNRDLRAAT